jgi:hypothetical protein
LARIAEAILVAVDLRGIRMLRAVVERVGDFVAVPVCGGSKNE